MLCPLRPSSSKKNYGQRLQPRKGYDLSVKWSGALVTLGLEVPKDRSIDLVTLLGGSKKGASYGLFGLWRRVQHSWVTPSGLQRQDLNYMEGNILEGTNQPGEPRLARRGDRGHEIMAENPLGNRTYGRVEELRDVTQICLWPKENKSIQTIWSNVQQTLTADEVLHVCKILRVRQKNNLMRYNVFCFG
jgi:hypothetical protein